MLKKSLLALVAICLVGACFSTDAQAAGPRRPLLRALVEANRAAANNPTFVNPVPTWGYRYTPPSYGWSFRPDTGWGFHQNGGTWGWGFGY
jgi:hypothetical protein